MKKFDSNSSLWIYLAILTLLCAGFVGGALALGESGRYLAQGYMMTPALAAIIVRIFFYEGKFSDAKLRMGKVKDYFRYWALSFSLTILSYALYIAFGSVTIDLTGDAFLVKLTQQFAASGQSITDNLPPGFTPKMMMFAFMAGQLTVLNILPGLITGFGEEFGHRGFMYERLKNFGLIKAFTIGGVLWFAWHLPLMLVVPTPEMSTAQTIINFIAMPIGSIATFIYLAYVLEKTGSIWVTAFAHIVMNNTQGAFSYFIVIQDQTLANLGVVVAAVIFCAALPGRYFWKKIKAEEEFGDIY